MKVTNGKYNENLLETNKHGINYEIQVVDELIEDHLTEEFHRVQHELVGFWFLDGNKKHIIPCEKDELLELKGVEWENLKKEHFKKLI